MELEERKRVFIDTSVLLEVAANGNYKELFEDENLTRKVVYAINPIVLQEFLLNVSHLTDKTNVEILEKNIEEIFEILPITVNSEEHANYLRALRNKFVHSNDLMILESANEYCDYFVTLDKDFLKGKLNKKVKVLPPLEFIEELGEKQ